MDDKLYILKFIRSDGETLAFDGEELYLAEKNTLLTRPNPKTTAAQYTEADGGEMIHQQNPTFTQKINGLIIPKTTDYWTLVMRLNAFWKINYTYKIIYKKKDGDLFAISKCWIDDGLQIKPHADEGYSEWDIALTIGNKDWREYAEDSSGNEIYANSVTLPLLSATTGGEEWDEVGLVLDNVGEVWTDAEGGVQNVYINSTSTIYPLWVVEGECVNPTLQNNTTDTVATYDGTVASGQTLTVDFEAGTAYLNTALVTRNLSGQVSCEGGNNVMGFNSDGGDTDTATIKWNGVLS